jgi:hypothetical protein
MSKAIGLLCLGVLFGGCARQTAPVAARAEIKQRELPVICRLVGREQTLTISAGPKGSVYSLADAEGKTLLSDASREELRVQFPVLSHQLDSAIVGMDATAIKE